MIKEETPGLNPEIARDLEKERKKRVFRRFLIVFSGTISIIGFIVSIYFLIEYGIGGSVTGSVIGNAEGNVYGLVIVSVLFLIWSVRTILWSRVNLKVNG